jgi:hypothetical protein
MMDVKFTMSNSKRPGANSAAQEDTGPKKTEEVTYVFIKEE